MAELAIKMSMILQPRLYSAFSPEKYSFSNNLIIDQDGKILTKHEIQDLHLVHNALTI